MKSRTPNFFTLETDHFFDKYFRIHNELQVGHEFNENKRLLVFIIVLLLYNIHILRTVGIRKNIELVNICFYISFYRLADKKANTDKSRINNSQRVQCNDHRLSTFFFSKVIMHIKHILSSSLLI